MFSGQVEADRFALLYKANNSSEPMKLYLTFYISFLFTYLYQIVFK